MKVVFMGTPQFAVPSLEAILENGFDVPLVVTSPDKPRRKHTDLPSPTPIKFFAESKSLKVLEVEDLKHSSFYESLKLCDADAIAVVAFRILPKEVFGIPKKGVFNLHASLLPNYRGAAPIQWAIINGERKTGVTTFFLKQKVDTGDIILQKEIAIHERETGTQLAVRLSKIGADAVVETLKKIQNGNVHLTKQESRMLRKAPKLTKENTMIDWSKKPKEIFNFVRALCEKPTAWTLLFSKRVKIYQTELMSKEIVNVESDKKQGSWIVHKEKLYIVCGENEMIEVLEMQLEGKKRMLTKNFLRGFNVSGNECFSSLYSE